MANEEADEQRLLLESIRDDWIRVGLTTEPADRERTNGDVLSAFQAIGHGTGSHLYIWVDSPMAGVIASTFIGFALNEPLKPTLMKQLDAATAPNILAAKEIRASVDAEVWHKVRKAVHQQVAAELATRHTNAEWQSWKERIGNYTWDQVWQTIGDPLYDHEFGRQARASGGLFEENLKTWVDAMMDGQFSAGTMAQLDALDLLGGLDLKPFQGLQRIARNCSWWWAFDVGAVICEPPAKIDVDGNRVSIEFRDGWRVESP